MFKNPFSFDGRIRRLEYCLSAIIYLVYFVTMLVLLSEFGIIDLAEPQRSKLTLYLTCSPAIYFMIAQAAKRCHDRGNSGWWQLIPFYGFWMLFADSDAGNNNYGENPKGPGYKGSTNGSSIPNIR